MTCEVVLAELDASLFDELDASDLLLELPDCMAVALAVLIQFPFSPEPNTASIYHPSARSGMMNDVWKRAAACGRPVYSPTSSSIVSVLNQDDVSISSSGMGSRSVMYSSGFIGWIVILPPYTTRLYSKNRHFAVVPPARL